MNIESLIADGNSGLSVTILAGHNGAGKSRYLQSLAMHYATQGVPVVVVCNTPFDRFRWMYGVKRISASRGRRLPSEVLKSAFVVALREGPIAFRTISKTLEYCGYATEIGVRIVRQNNDAYAGSFSPTGPFESRENKERIQSALVYTSDVSPDGIAWLNFYDGDFKSLRQQSYAVLMAHEPQLRKVGALQRIELFLRRNNGEPLPLLEASSGELTLIATLVFLSVEVKRESVVIIDEPENSLHPEWQKQYVARLASLLFYSQSKIYIATHAPIVVSGAQSDGDLALRLFHVSPSGVQLLDAQAKSVEGTLWQVFQTVTPQNHFVSQTLSEELTELAAGERDAQDVEETISRMTEASYDNQQKRFFEGARRLADKVALGDSQDD
jgi:energy-coupling factor transporter ATP-binding protein EcfA2